MNALLTLPIVLPILGAAASILAGRVKYAQRAISITVLGVMVVLSAVLLPTKGNEARGVVTFEPVDNEELLAIMSRVPVSRWTMIGDEEGTVHLGPVAEDFYEAFGLGLGETAIGLGDIDGVNFAATQGLERRTTALHERLDRQAEESAERERARDEELHRLRREVEELRARLSAYAALEERLTRLEAAGGVSGGEQRLTGAPTR